MKTVGNTIGFVENLRAKPRKIDNPNEAKY